MNECICKKMYLRNRPLDGGKDKLTVRRRSHRSATCVKDCCWLVIWRHRIFLINLMPKSAPIWNATVLKQHWNLHLIVFFLPHMKEWLLLPYFLDQLSKKIRVVLPRISMSKKSPGNNFSDCRYYQRPVKIFPFYPYDKVLYRKATRLRFHRVFLSFHPLLTHSSQEYFRK